VSLPERVAARLQLVRREAPRAELLMRGVQASRSETGNAFCDRIDAVMLDAVTDAIWGRDLEGAEALLRALHTGSR
jgi:hypothetical protein